MHHVRAPAGKRPATRLHGGLPGASRHFRRAQRSAAEAEKRLREEPSKYFQHIYGKEEVGGTSVLYLSAVPFEQLGLPANLPRDPMPLLTYRVLSKIPSLVTLGGLLLGGIWWITNRREEVAKAEEK